jgi:hypothetical protein
MEKGTIKWFRGYEAFDYGEAKPMTLEAAAREAARLAAEDPKHFYRVVPVDAAMKGFRIEKVSKAAEWKRYSERFGSQRRAGRFDYAPYSYTYR